MSKQVNVRFEGEVLKQLEDLVNAQAGKNMSDVLREAVNTSHWLLEQQKANKKILIQEDDKTPPVQVVFR
jgi:Arc/MetJ-type ribon-helix-helix transcriptional regulator